MIKKFFDLLFKLPEDKSANVMENPKLLCSERIQPTEWRLVERSEVKDSGKSSVYYMLQYKTQYDIRWSHYDHTGIFYNKTEALAALE